ncbi:MliC family protein [Jannaschia sp. LMIT008]|uniref:MliC family protein n=1 Tax=Jannaschia maritima TaxID=3032585 RepID=UPI0028120C05|nr:MliC family protein [Jannaschia sp. LMIT008]
MTRILVPIVLLTLTACDPAEPLPDDPSAAIPSGPPTGATRSYECDTGVTLTASRDAGSAQLRLETGEVLRLPRIPEAAPTTYASDGFVWFVQGNRGVLTDRGGQKNCRVQAGPSPVTFGTDDTIPLGQPIVVSGDPIPIN